MAATPPGAPRGSAIGEALRPREGERLLPVISAFLLVISFPPLHLLVPPFVALVPFAVWVHGLPEDAKGSRAALRGGALLGLVYFGILVYWILIALVWFTALAVAAYLATLGALVLLAAFFGWSLHRLVHRGRIPLWLALPLAWTAMEWIQGHLGELSFPWLGLGSSLTGFPELVGVAELVGARGATFWIALANGALASAILYRRDRRRWNLALPGFALVVLVPMAWGLWRASTLETRPAAEIAVVQPNIAEDVKLDREEATDSTFRALESLMPLLEAPVDLVVWPEVTLPEFIRHPDSGPVRDRVNAFAAAAGSGILFGAYDYDADGRERPSVFNSAFLMMPDGLSDYTYSKRNLVPVVERVPFANPDWFGELSYFGALGKGAGRPPLRVAGTAYGVLICYESIFAEASRDFRRAGAEVLLNITNDAWYGRERWYGRTTALWQHPAHMVMRAIENRVGVARSANTGISLFIDPIGRISGSTELFDPALRTGTVHTTDVLTLYTRYGDVTGNGAAATTFLLLLAVYWRRRASGLN